MKRRIKVTLTEIRRTRISESSVVLHVVCPACMAATGTLPVAEPDEDRGGDVAMRVEPFDDSVR